MLFWHGLPRPADDAGYPENGRLRGSAQRQLATPTPPFQPIPKHLTSEHRQVGWKRFATPWWPDAFRL